MEKQIKFEIIEDCYQRILAGDFNRDLVKKLIELENEQQVEQGHEEMWHLPGEAPEREITYDENLRSNEKIIAIVKYRIGTRAKIITAHLVDKRGNLRFEGFKFSVKDIVMWKLVHKPKHTLYTPENGTKTETQHTSET